MADLRVTDIANTDGTSPVDLIGQSAAKSWVNFNGATPAIGDSLNISSLTDIGVGDFRLNFTNSWSSLNSPCVSAQLDNAQGICPFGLTTVNQAIFQCWVTGVLNDFGNAQGATFGDLA